MRKFLIMVLLAVIFIGGVSMIGAADAGVSASDVKALFLAQPPSGVDPAPMVARSTALANESALAAAEAAQALTRQAEVQQAWEIAYARETQAVIEQTQAVYAEQTRVAQQATIEAGQAQATATAYWGNVAAQQEADKKAAEIRAMELKLEEIELQNQATARMEDLKLQALASTSWFWANWPLWVFLVLCAALAGASYAGFRVLAIKQSTAMGPIPMDANGNSYAVVVGGKIHNPNQMTAPTIDPKRSLPAASDKDFEVAKLRQGVSAIQGLGRSGYRRDAYTAAQGLAGAVGAQAQIEAAEWPTDPSAWDLSRWGGKTLPLGVGLDRSGIEWNPAQTPNLIVAGTSGGGKSQMFTRPLIAEALASKMLVYAMSEKMIDFAIFGDHPNLHRVRGKAQGLLTLLEWASKEVDRRVDVMERIGKGTAYDYIENAQEVIGPRIMIVVDGLVNFIFSEPESSVRKQLWAQAISVASLCRATGVMLVFGTTDPSHRMGDNWLAIRENCGRVATRLMEEDASRLVLQMTGAEKLKGAQFIARLDGEPVKGVAFWPKDQEIVRFLADHPVQALPSGFVVPQSAPVKVEPKDVYSHETIRLAETIMDHWIAGASKSAMARAAGFTQYGGSYAAQIDAAVRYLTEKYGSTVSTTSTASTFARQNVPAAD